MEKSFVFLLNSSFISNLSAMFFILEQSLQVVTLLNAGHDDLFVAIRITEIIQVQAHLEHCVQAVDP